MSRVNSSGSDLSEVSSYSSGATNHPRSISVPDITEVSEVSLATNQHDVSSSRCSSPDGEDDDEDDSEDEGEDDEDIVCFRMTEVDDHPWVSDIDAINFQVSRDISMSSALIYCPFESEEEDSYKFQIYHTKSGKMILEQSVKGLEETNQPEVGKLKFENPLKIESNKTYTAVLETGLRKSNWGREGFSVICSRVDETNGSLMVVFTTPTKDGLGER